MFQVLLNILSPMMMLMFFVLSGFILSRFHILPQGSDKIISKLESNYIIPLMILHSMILNCSLSSIRDNLPLILFSAGNVLAIIFLAKPISRIFAKAGYEQKLFEYSLIFLSYGFLGNGLVRELYGDEGLFRYILYCMPTNIACFSYGVPMLTPEEVKKNQSRIRNLLNPTLVSIAVGMILGLTGAGKIIPRFLMNALEVCSNMMGPVAMLLTGVVIGGFDFHKIIGDKKIFGVCFIRMLVFPVLTVAVFMLLHADPMILILALIANATPLGLFQVIYPASYGKDTTLGASMALMSNLLCMVTLPVLYSLLQTIIG